MRLRSLFSVLVLAVSLCSCGGDSATPQAATPVVVPPAPVVDPLNAVTGGFLDFALVGTKLFVAAGFDGVRIFEVADLDHPQQVGGIPAESAIFPSPEGIIFPSADNVLAIAANEGVAAVSLYPGCLGSCMPGIGELRLYDLATPATPRLLTSLVGAPVAMVLQGSRLIALQPDAYFQPHLRVFDLQTPSAPVLLSDTLAGGARTLQVVGDRIYLGFAERMGDGDGVEVLALSPEGLVSPLAIAGSPPFDPGRNSVAAAFGAVYTASGTSELRVYEAATLGSVAPQRFPLPKAAQALSLTGSRLYVTQEDGGVAWYGLAAPLAPVLQGSIAVDGRAIGVRTFATFGVVRLAEERDQGSVGSLLRPERIRFFRLPD